MGQLVYIDEDKLDKLEVDSAWCSLYRDWIQMCQKEFYPNFTYNSRFKYGHEYEYNYDYDYKILSEMYFEICHKRKPWWKRWLFL